MPKNLELPTATSLFVAELTPRRRKLLTLTQSVNDTGRKLRELTDRCCSSLDTSSYEQASQFALNVQTLVIPLLNDESLESAQASLTVYNQRFLESLLWLITQAELENLQGTLEDSTLTVTLAAEPTSSPQE